MGEVKSINIGDVVGDAPVGVVDLGVMGSSGGGEGKGVVAVSMGEVGELESGLGAVLGVRGWEEGWALSKSGSAEWDVGSALLDSDGGRMGYDGMSGDGLMDSGLGRTSSGGWVSGIGRGGLLDSSDGGMLDGEMEGGGTLKSGLGRATGGGGGGLLLGVSDDWDDK